MLDYGMVLYAPLMANILSAEAPGIVMDCRAILVDHAMDMLDAGDLDLAIGPFASVPDRFQKRLMKKSTEKKFIHWKTR